MVETAQWVSRLGELHPPATHLISHRSLGFHSADPLVYLCCAGIVIKRNDHDMASEVAGLSGFTWSPGLRLAAPAQP